MDTTDTLPGQGKLDRQQEEQRSETARELVSENEIDIRALLLDETNPDFERLHNLMMMC